MATIFNIPKIMEGILQALSEEKEPNPDAMAWMLQEGPLAFDAVVDRLRELEACEAAQTSRMAEISERRESCRKEQQRLKDFTQDVLVRYFSGKVKTSLNTVWSQSATKYDYEVEDINQIPSEYLNVTTALDKAKAKADFKGGTKIPGLKITTTEEVSLRIKT